MDKKIQEYPNLGVLGLQKEMRKNLLFFVSVESDLTVNLGHSVND